MINDKQDFEILYHIPKTEKSRIENCIPFITQDKNIRVIKIMGECQKIYIKTKDNRIMFYKISP